MNFHSQSYLQKDQPVLSILIPSWNNLPYLKLCIKSIQKHSQIPSQIIIHINDGKDGSLEWARENQIDHTHSQDNIGVCRALNAASTLAQGDYIVFLNDDMYVLPEWDTTLMSEIQSIGEESFFLSGTMIEPRNTGNPCVIHHDFGQNIEDFQEERLLKEYQSFDKNDWSGSSWPPNIVARKVWEDVGGYSVEFSPGMSSDPDFSMKLWEKGIRYFKGMGKSRVYHFQARSTQRIEKNNGRKQFLEKWGIPQSAFYKYYLRMGKPWKGPLVSPNLGFGLGFAKLKAWVKASF